VLFVNQCSDSDKKKRGQSKGREEFSVQSSSGPFWAVVFYGPPDWLGPKVILRAGFTPPRLFLRSHGQAAVTPTGGFGQAHIVVGLNGSHFLVLTDEQLSPKQTVKQIRRTSKTKLPSCSSPRPRHKNHFLHKTIEFFIAKYFSQA